MRRVILIVLVGVGVVAGVRLAGRSTSTVAAPTPTCPVTSCVWNAVGAPQPGKVAQFDSVLALSPTDVWIGGMAGAGQIGPTPIPEGTVAFAPNYAVLEHWNGQRYQLAQIPPMQGSIGGLAGTTTASLWAVVANTDQSFPAKVLHWDGHQWADSPLPLRAGVVLTGIAARGSDAWAVGTVKHPRGPLILRFHGSHWRIQAIPKLAVANPELSAIVSPTVSDAWAFGDWHQLVQDGHEGMLLLHWNGTHWSRQPPPTVSPDRTFLISSAVAINPRDIWAVGTQGHRGHDDALPLALHWNGHT